VCKEHRALISVMAEEQPQGVKKVSAAPKRKRTRDTRQGGLENTRKAPTEAEAPKEAVSVLPQEARRPADEEGFK
jgi:hypothetical protein